MAMVRDFDLIVGIFADVAIQRNSNGILRFLYPKWNTPILRELHVDANVFHMKSNRLHRGAVAAVIKERQKQLGVTSEQLIEATGMARTSYYRGLNNDGLTSRELDIISGMLKMTFSELIQRAEALASKEGEER